MLTSGQLIKGIISETATECLVEQRVGTMHFPKKRVEGVRLNPSERPTNTGWLSFPTATSTNA